MKKKLPRIMACLMACVIAFNVIAIPKAKASAAVVGTSALATSALASYMTATGVPLTVISGGAAAASAGTASLVSGYAAATGATYEVVTTAIAAGATISGGAIILTAAAVAVLAGITAWVISNYNVRNDGVPVPIAPNLTSEGLYNGTRVAYFGDLITEQYPYAVLVANSSSMHRLYLTQEPLEAFDSGSKKLFGYASQSLVKTYDWYSYDIASKTFAHSGGGGSNDLISFYQTKYIWSNYDLKYADGTLAAAYTEPVPIEDWANPAITTQLAEDYAPLSELPESSQLVIETGVPPETAPASLPAAIYTYMAYGNFAPTYEEQSVTNPDPAPDPDDETVTDPDANIDTGLLRRIAIACEALADKILGGIESIFAPDPALMQEISEAFTEKFGFVSTLHNLGTDLLSINASSAPPVVYIHLEDAEGSINYGGTAKALDMSWYARYKPDVDRIMSGFLWIGFLWLLFKRASAIINGAEMATDYGTDIHDGFRIRGERNGKRF